MTASRGRGVPAATLLGAATGGIVGTDHHERRGGDPGQAIVERLHRSLPAVDQRRGQAKRVVGAADRLLAGATPSGRARLAGHPPR